MEGMKILIDALWVSSNSVPYAVGFSKEYLLRERISRVESVLKAAYGLLHGCERRPERFTQQAFLPLEVFLDVLDLPASNLDMLGSREVTRWLIPSRIAREMAQAPVPEVPKGTLPSFNFLTAYLSTPIEHSVQHSVVAALLRFLDGILTALRQMLTLLLAALSRMVDSAVFALVVIAVYLRYGRRQDSPSDVFLLIRRSESSAGTRAGSLPSAC